MVKGYQMTLFNVIFSQYFVDDDRNPQQISSIWVGIMKAVGFLSPISVRGLLGINDFLSHIEGSSLSQCTAEQ